MIYIHVPFCKSFCTYCDFYSEIPGEGMYDAYTKQLCQEIHDRAAEMDNSLKTLYFGGGTPSVLPLSHLTRILLALEECGHGGPYTEFTMECNPEDLVEKGLPYLESLRSLGVNRMSMGVQSLDDDLLRWMNRRHTAEGAREAFRLVRQAGFENVSIDLIFGLSNLKKPRTSSAATSTTSCAAKWLPPAMSITRFPTLPNLALRPSTTAGTGSESPTWGWDRRPTRSAAAAAAGILRS